MAEAFPLHWPDGWPRAKYRPASKYKLGFGTARDELLRELRLMGAKQVVISSNLPTRIDGLPYADAPKRIPDPGVAVYFMRNNVQQVIACDKWASPGENVRAIGLTVEALRGIARAGATELLDRAFSGFKALPPAGGTSPSSGPLWHDILGVPPTAELEVIKSRYRALAAEHHPDRGGDAGAMAMINRAWEQAQAARAS